MPAPAHPETDSERTMLIPRLKVDQGPEDRAKVSPAATARRLVSVPAGLDSSASDATLAADVAARGQASRREVMNRYHVGSGRATKIIRMSQEVGHGPQTSAR